MNVIELSQEEFRNRFPQLLQEAPGAEVRIIEGGMIAARLILPNGGKPVGFPDGIPFIGEGPSIADLDSEQRD